MKNKTGITIRRAGTRNQIAAWIVAGLFASTAIIFSVRRAQNSTTLPHPFMFGGMPGTPFGPPQAGGAMATFGGMPGMQNLQYGAITETNKQRQTINIYSQFGVTQTFRVLPDTKISTVSSVKVKDLKINDVVQLTGLSRTAANMVAFQSRTGRGKNPKAMAEQSHHFSQTEPPPAQVNSDFDTITRHLRQAATSVTGRVTSRSPLTISISPEVAVSLKLEPDSNISRISTIPYGQLKVGETAVAFGDTGTDGIITPTGAGIIVESELSKTN